MNKSLVVVCDELHITNFESILHETISGISVEQYTDMDNISFKKAQLLLNKSERDRLQIIFVEIMEAIS